MQENGPLHLASELRGRVRVKGTPRRAGGSLCGRGWGDAHIRPVTAAWSVFPDISLPLRLSVCVQISPLHKNTSHVRLEITFASSRPPLERLCF